MENRVPPKKKMFRMSTKECIDVSKIKGFEYCSDLCLPEVTDGAVRLRVAFAGACVYEAPGKKPVTTQRGIHHTSLLPGYEISAIVDAVSTSAKTSVRPGDKVILYPEEDIGFASGIDEYIVIKQVENLVRLPAGVSLEVASMLPNCALTALSAVQKIKATVDEKISEPGGTCQILIIGAGALGLWTVVLTHALIASTCRDSKVHITMADTSADKLMAAKDYGCYSVVHWCEAVYEEQIIDRTLNACHGKPDVIIDYASSHRSIARALRVLKQKGTLFVGGYHNIVVPISPQALAARDQSISGVKPGTKDDLEKLVTMVADSQVQVPHYATFPVKNINKVFQDITSCKITGRAVLQVSPTEL